jgi:hypothetical protein
MKTMSEMLSGTKKLFICTKPYQYMIARLIKQGCGFENCDIVILDHFFEAANFCKKASDSGVWNKVMYMDDRLLNQFNFKLNPAEKFFFYRSWEKFLPSSFADISMYSEVFLAHDTVPVEYAIMRKFNSERKKVTIFEEGYGNYINNSEHKSLIMKGLKRFSPWLGLPGGYIGSLKWIDSIWVQRPELIRTSDIHSLRPKTKQLPMYLKEFLQIPEIIQEMYTMYPELGEIADRFKDHQVLSVVLTESWHDQIKNRKQHIDQIIDIVNGTLPGIPIFIKQHPGESVPIETASKQVSLLPKQFPFELLYLIMKKNNIKNDESLEIYLIDSMLQAFDFHLFCDLAVKLQIRYITV